MSWDKILKIWSASKYILKDFCICAYMCIVPGDLEVDEAEEGNMLTVK